MLTAKTSITGIIDASRFLISPCNLPIPAEQPVFINGIITPIVIEVAIPSPEFAEEIVLVDGVPQAIEEGCKLGLNDAIIYTSEAIEAGSAVIPILPEAIVVNAGDTLEWEQIIGRSTKVATYIPEGSNLIIFSEPIDPLPEIGDILIWQRYVYNTPWWIVEEIPISIGLTFSATAVIPDPAIVSTGFDFGIEIGLIVKNPEEITTSLEIGFYFGIEQIVETLNWIYLTKDDLLQLTNNQLIVIN